MIERFFADHGEPLLLVLLISGGAHLAVLGVRIVGRVILRSQLASQEKALTLTSFLSSVLVFAIYFVAFGFVLREFGVSLTAYLAGASVFGLAVSFGSQGIVQDVITGLTLVFSDLLDVGDMVEIGGQIGIVQDIGIRFTRLVNFAGASVSIPNRTVTHVINYPKGFVRAYLDVRLPADSELARSLEEEVDRIASDAFEQFRGVFLLPPQLLGRQRTSSGREILRVKFRLWPGQGALLEGPVRGAILHAIRARVPDFSDWMAAVHYRAEPKDADLRRRLPRPLAIDRSRN